MHCDIFTLFCECSLLDFKHYRWLLFFGGTSSQSPILTAKCCQQISSHLVTKKTIPSWRKNTCLSKVFHQNDSVALVMPFASELSLRGWAPPPPKTMSSVVPTWVDEYASFPLMHEQHNFVAEVKRNHLLDLNLFLFLFTLTCYYQT